MQNDSYSEVILTVDIFLLYITIFKIKSTLVKEQLLVSFVYYSLRQDFYFLIVYIDIHCHSLHNDITQSVFYLGFYLFISIVLPMLWKVDWLLNAFNLLKRKSKTKLLWLLICHCIIWESWKAIIRGIFLIFNFLPVKKILSTTTECSGEQRRQKF